MMLTMLDSMLEFTLSVVGTDQKHATATPFRKYPFSSDQGSHAGLGSISIWLSDRPGTLSAVVFMHKPDDGARQLVLLPFDLQLAGPSMHTQLECLAPLCTAELFNFHRPSQLVIHKNRTLLAPRTSTYTTQPTLVYASTTDQNGMDGKSYLSQSVLVLGENLRT